MPGGPLSLQNWWTARSVVGGFDSRPPPREPGSGHSRRLRTHAVTCQEPEHDAVIDAAWMTSGVNDVNDLLAITG